MPILKIMIDNPTVGGNTDDWGWDSSTLKTIDACDYGAWTSW